MESNFISHKLIDEYFTENAKKLLRAAHSVAQYKQAHKPEISTSTVFIAAIEWGKKYENQAPQPIRNLADLFRGDLKTVYDKIKSDFFIGSNVEINPDFELSKKNTYTNSVNAILLKASKRGGVIGLDGFLLELLEYTYSHHYVGSKDFIQRFGTIGLGFLDYSTALFRKNERDHARDPNSPIANTLRDRPMWICQYRYEDNSRLDQNMARGAIEPWLIEKRSVETIQGTMQVGDIVAVWRTVDKDTPAYRSKSRGGITAWAKIETLPYSYDEEYRIKIELLHTFQQTPISRDSVLSMLSESNVNWPGQTGFRQLKKDEPLILAHLVSLPQVATESHDIQVMLSSDRAETDKDLLHRVPLAFSLASLINSIQDDQTSRVRNDNSEAAFVLHIDSPWGGGKTTFANFLVRILNPGAFKKIDHANSTKINCDKELLPGLDDRINAHWPNAWKERYWVPVMFNAWEHQHVHPPWWDFYQSIRKGYLSKLSFHEYIMHRISEIWWRVTMPGVWTPLLGLIILGLLIVGLFAILGTGESGQIALETISTGARSDFTKLQTWQLLLVLLGGGSGLALLKSLRNSFQNVINAAGQSVDKNNIGDSDPLSQLRKRFHKVMSRLSNKAARPLLVVIDDLDRCNSNYVVELIRGLLTIFKSQHVVYVLLGDKHWIETAFANVHNNMKNAHREVDTSFGARFAEKAIQLSFLLPSIDDKIRESYLSHLLSPQKPSVQSKPQHNTEIQLFVESARRDLQKTMNPSQATATAERLQKEAKTKFNQNPEEMEIVSRGINIEALINTVATERYREQVSHSLMAYKSLLPENPRRVKRIINMIAMYQSSAQVMHGILPDTEEWQQLVLWVVLMSEYPKLWECLSRSPDLTNILTKADKDKAEKISNENQKKIILKHLENEKAMRLFQRSENPARHSGLSKEAVKWLTNITPIK